MAESYGGKDEPVDTLTSSLVDINVSPTFDPLRVKETPNQAIYQAYEETGTDLAQVRPCPNVCNWAVRLLCEFGITLQLIARESCLSIMQLCPVLFLIVAQYLSEASFCQDLHWCLPSGCGARFS